MVHQLHSTGTTTAFIAADLDALQANQSNVRQPSWLYRTSSAVLADSTSAVLAGHGVAIAALSGKECPRVYDT